MKTIRSVFLFLFALILSEGLPAATQKLPYFSHLGLEDGLSQLSVLCIYQDSNGFMWFGTRNGLNRYDGRRMICYKQNSADASCLVDNHITVLEEDASKNLWIGSMHGLSRLDLTTDRITAYPGTIFPQFSNGARSLLFDSRQRLWIGTHQGLFLYDPVKDDFIPVDLSGMFKGGRVTAIYETSIGKLVICTQDNGIFFSSLELDDVTHYSKSSETNPIPSNDINGVFEDSRHQIWLATADSGLVLLAPDGNTETLTTSNSILTTNTTRCLAGSEQKLYIGTDDGLYTYDLESHSIEAHSGAQHRRGDLSHFSVCSVHVDCSGNLWVGTYAGGVDYCSKYAGRFSFHEFSLGSEDLSGIYGPIMCYDDHDDSNQIYIATEGHGLLEYNLNNNHSLCFQYDLSSNISSHNIIKSIMREGNTLWCGTTQGAIYEFDICTQRFTLYHKLPQNRSVSIYAITRGENGDLWLATSKPGYGLIRLDKNLRSQHQFSVEGRIDWSFPSLRCLMQLEPGIFLIGSRHDGLFKFDTNTQTLTQYHEQGSGHNYLPSNYITSIVQDDNSHVWISTFGGGISLFDPEIGVLKTISKQDGLADNDICMIVLDQNNNLWLSSNNFITKYEPIQESIRNYYVGIFGAQEFSPHCGALLPNGNICFSTSNGLISFLPNRMQLNTFIPPIRLTDLSIDNKRQIPGQDGPLTKVLDETEKLLLKYNQNNITLSYCALNYIYSNLNQYAFRLIGHDKDWNYVGNRQEAYYTNLRPGKYLFEVKAANNDGLWNEEPRQLSIHILPPFWATWYAYLLYTLILLGTLILIFYFVGKKRTLEQSLSFKQKEQQQQEEFHQARMRMYTSFSHELRTPLTLIISPLEELLNSGGFNLSIKNKLELIYNNSQRLLLLVNQLMDLRKSETGKMEIKIIQDDICLFVGEIYKTFKHLAREKNIHLDFAQDGEHLMAWYDRFLFEKLIFNLLSNALKNTGYNGHVKLSLLVVSPEDISPLHRKPFTTLPNGVRLAHITVQDDGCGIPADELEIIFEPFFQGKNNPSGKGSGTGIGLSLCQSVIKMHHGTIWAENNQEMGATFHVVIPIDKAAYKDDELETDARINLATDVVPFERISKDFEFDRRYRVLLVEDNDAVRSYVKECLDHYFDVIETDDGESAWEQLQVEEPDIVISDIMLPNKDGLELCMQIKENMLTVHIPVILMTAKSMAIHIIEGFSAGADDYIVKPFNINVLISRIKNILASRKELKKLYGKRFTPEILGIDLSAGEDRFAQKLFTLIEQNLSNPNLNIDMICREIGLSRTNLYRKMKSITELSPVELIRNLRLQMAADLLLNSNYTIAEIAMDTGFNSHAYFTSCFKSVYKCTPTEYMLQHGKQDFPPINTSA